MLCSAEAGERPTLPRRGGQQKNNNTNHHVLKAKAMLLTYAQGGALEISNADLNGIIYSSRAM
jgi:hypothetical protein